MRAARSASEENTTALPSCSNSSCVGRRALEDGALGREIAEQRDKAALRLERFVTCGDDRAIDVERGIGRKTLAQRLASDRHAIEMEQRLEFAQQRAHSAARRKNLPCSRCRPASD